MVGQLVGKMVVVRELSWVELTVRQRARMSDFVLVIALAASTDLRMVDSRETMMAARKERRLASLRVDRSADNSAYHLVATTATATVSQWVALMAVMTGCSTAEMKVGLRASSKADKMVD